MYPAIKWREAEPPECTRARVSSAIAAAQHKPWDSNETGWLTGKGYGRHSAGAGPSLGTEPKFCSRELIMRKARSKETALTKRQKRWVKTYEHLPSTWLLSPLLPSWPLFCRLSPIISAHLSLLSRDSWSWAAGGTHCTPASCIHSHCAWVIFITQGHFSFTYP